VRLNKAKPILLQLALIILMSVSSSYAFQHTETAFKINEVCVSRYVAYAVTVFLVYVAFSRYKKYVGLAFSLALSVVVLSPIGQKAIIFFPSLTPFLAMFLGIITVVVVPGSRGRGYFEFVIMLILPAVLAESRIGGSLRLLATTESIEYGLLSAITACVVGGYFYLRYANLANLSSRELLANGSGEADVLRVSTWSSQITAVVVACASITAAILMTIAPILADVVRFTMLGSPVYILVLAMGAGIVVVAIVRILSRSYKEVASR
jgi:hypothetical protein